MYAPDPDWLMRMADKDDGSITSTGGLVLALTQQNDQSSEALATEIKTHIAGIEAAELEDNETQPW